MVTATSAAILLAIMAVCTFGAIRAHRRRPGAWTLALLGTYVTVLCAVVFLPFNPSLDVDSVSYAVAQTNLLPFERLDPTEFALNIALTVPLGVLLILRGTPLLRAMVIGAVTSVAIEAVQFLGGAVFGSIRATDVNDVMANTMGCIAGAAIVRGLQIAVRTFPMQSAAPEANRYFNLSIPDRVS